MLARLEGEPGRSTPQTGEMGRVVFQSPGDALLQAYIAIDNAPQRILEELTAFGEQLPKDMLGKLIPPGQLDAVLETLREMPEKYTIPYVLWRAVAPWSRPLPCQGQRGLPDGGVCSALTFLKEFDQALKGQGEEPDYSDALRTAAGKAISPDCPHHWDKRALAVIQAWEKLAESPIVGKLLRNLPAESASFGALLSLAAQGQSCGETWKQMQPTREWTGPPTSTRATSSILGSGDCSISPGLLAAILGLSALAGLMMGCRQSHARRSR